MKQMQQEGNLREDVDLARTKLEKRIKLQSKQQLELNWRIDWCQN